MATGQDIPTAPATGSDVASTDSANEVCAERSRQVQQDGRRQFIGRSGKLLIYTPPLIQLFIPSKAMAATPSSG